MRAFGGALLPLRLLSVVLGAALVVVAYLVAKAVYPELAWPALGTAALIAFLPQHIAMTAGVENDTLAELLLAVILLRLVRWLKHDGLGTRKALVITGILIGLALLTKAGVYITVPLALVAVWLKTYRRTPRGKAPVPGPPRPGRSALPPAPRAAARVCPGLRATPSNMAASTYWACSSTIVSSSDSRAPRK